MDEQNCFLSRMKHRKVLHIFLLFLISILSFIILFFNDTLRESVFTDHNLTLLCCFLYVALLLGYAGNILDLLCIKKAMHDLSLDK